MLLMKKECLVFLHVVLFDRIRTCFCWDIENRIVKSTFWTMGNGSRLFLFCVLLCCFLMFADFVVGELFFVTLEVFDVVKVINGIV